MFEDIREHNEALVRKALNGSLFAAPISAAAVTADNLFDTDGNLRPLPAGYGDGGLTTDDGVRIARSIETSNITSWQRQTPTRSDKSSDTETLQVDFQELKRTTLELYTGADISGLERGTNGAMSIRKPEVPDDPYWRLLALAVDLVDGEELVIAMFYPKAKVETYADQAFAKGDTAINWGMTFTTFLDADLGYSKDFIVGGPGFDALAAEMDLTGS